MRVGVVDVGSNTLRLLVAEPGVPLAAVHEERVRLGLGEEIERNGRIGAPLLAQAAAAAAELVAAARAHACALVDVVVASPGRQAANAEALLRALAGATGVPVRQLTREEEGILAWRGAVAASAPAAEPVAVVDVGGGSTQIVVGTLSGGPAWARSVDLGALRLTARCLPGDPPGKKALAAARRETRAAFGAVLPPLPRCALAAGGSARNLRRLVGRTLGGDELAEAQRVLRKVPSGAVAEEYGVDRARARTLAAGAVVLEEARLRLGGVPLEVARGGLREGVALSLLAQQPAA